MLLVAVYKDESMRDMRLISGTSDPSIVSQISTIMKKALDDFDKDPNSKNSEPSKQQ